VGQLVLADVAKDRLKGEVMDLQHGGAYQSGTIVECDDEFLASKDSDVCIVAAGVRQNVRPWFAIPPP
jgi:L-lactate dehydrogenase